MVEIKKIIIMKKNAILLQCPYSCKLPASFMFSSAAPEGGACGTRWGPLLLKVAPIQPSVTAAFHLQWPRDRDCQMWELLCATPDICMRVFLAATKQL